LEPTLDLYSYQNKRLAANMLLVLYQQQKLYTSGKVWTVSFKSNGDKTFQILYNYCTNGHYCG